MIVFIHRGDSNYLPYTLAQALHTNPQAQVVLIGDESNFYSGIHHELIVNYSQSANVFAQIYQHLSTNSVEYELFCFQRWFILQDFMAHNQIEKCIYLDSDVMLYSEVSTEQICLEPFDLALTGCVPSSTFINRFSAISSLCQLICQMYQSSFSLEIIAALFQDRLRESITTSISDMDAFEFYRDSYPDQVADLLEIKQGSTYDRGMTRSDGFYMQGGIKQIQMKQQQPVGRHLPSNQLIQFKALHFQGSSKNRIHDYFTGQCPLEKATLIISQTSLFQKLEICKTAIKNNPNSPELYYELGGIWMELGRFEEAGSCFQTAIALMPSFFGAYINLGVSLIQQGRSKDAIPYYYQALKLQPDSALAYGNLGYAYGQLGQYRESNVYGQLSSAIETVERQPDWAEAHRNLGQAYQNADQLELAIQCFNHALKLDPNFIEAQNDLAIALLLQLPNA